MNATRTFAGSQLIPAGSEFALKIHNPIDDDYFGFNVPKGTRLLMPEGDHMVPAPDGDYVLSIGEDNSYSLRKLDSIGNFERCVKQGMFLVYRCWGKDDKHRFPIPFCE
jgi:hypothetical protein